MSLWAGLAGDLSKRRIGVGVGVGGTEVVWCVCVCVVGGWDGVTWVVGWSRGAGRWARWGEPASQRIACPLSLTHSLSIACCSQSVVLGTAYLHRPALPYPTLLPVSWSWSLYSQAHTLHACMHPWFRGSIHSSAIASHRQGVVSLRTNADALSFHTRTLARSLAAPKACIRWPMRCDAHRPEQRATACHAPTSLTRPSSSPAAAAEARASEHPRGQPGAGVEGPSRPSQCSSLSLGLPPGLSPGDPGSRLRSSFLGSSLLARSLVTPPYVTA